MGKIKILIFEKESQIILEVDSSSKISEGKKLYELKVNSSNRFNSKYDYTWLFNGMILSDDKSFDSYNIIDEDIIISNKKLSLNQYPNKQTYNNRFENIGFLNKNIGRSDFLKTRGITIFIINIATNDKRSLEIGKDKTVKELKKEIEELFNLDYSLDEQSIRVKYAGMKIGKLIQEQDENKTLFENHFKSECIVSFGREKNKCYKCCEDCHK